MIFAAYFYFLFYHSPGIRRNTRKSEIYKYNRQHNHQSAYSQWDSHIFLSPAVSVGHVDPFSKQIPEPTEVQSQGQCSQWAVGDEKGEVPWSAGGTEQGEQGRQSREVLVALWLLSQLEQGRWQVGDATTKPECWLARWLSCLLTAGQDGVSTHLGKGLRCPWPSRHTAQPQCLWLTSTPSAATTFCLG